MTFPGQRLGPHVAAPSFRMMRLFLGRSRQASFTRAAGNNIVPVFGRVGSHIWDRSIRNRPQCGTINPWPPQQIRAVTAECRTINQTRREKPALSRPSLPPPSLHCCRCPMGLQLSPRRLGYGVIAPSLEVQGGSAAAKCVFHCSDRCTIPRTLATLEVLTHQLQF